MPWGNPPWGAHFVAAGSPPPPVLLMLSPCAFQEEDVEAEEGTASHSSSAVTGGRMFSKEWDTQRGLDFHSGTYQQDSPCQEFNSFQPQLS